jgi:hypothetical protein
MDDINPVANEALAVRYPIWPGLGNGPYWPIPPFWPFGQLSPGDVHGLFLNHLLKSKAAAKGDSSQAMQSSLTHLASTGLLKPAEVDTLGKMIDLLDTVEEGRQLLASLRLLHLKLLSANSGPIPLMIISIALDSVVNYVAQGNLAGRNVAKADVEGCLGGCGAGAIGGPWGVLIGGVVGSVAMSLAEAYGGSKGS